LPKEPEKDRIDRQYRQPTLRIELSSGRPSVGGSDHRWVSLPLRYDSVTLLDHFLAEYICSQNVTLVQFFFSRPGRALSSMHGLATTSLELSDTLIQSGRGQSRWRLNVASLCVCSKSSARIENFINRFCPWQIARCRPTASLPQNLSLKRRTTIRLCQVDQLVDLQGWRGWRTGLCDSPLRQFLAS
jgi:hypothetical protein